MKRIKLLTILGILSIVTYSFTGNEGKDQHLRKKAARIHAKAFTIDSHNDTPMWFTDSTYDFGINHANMRPRNRVDLPRMEAGGLDAAFFAVFIGQGERTSEGNQKALEQALETFKAIHRNVSLNSNKAAIALSANDGPIIAKENKKAVYIGVENGYPIGNDLKNIERFHKLGARYITLCHSSNNDICDSSTDTIEHNGVSDFGGEVIAEMNRLGLMVDVSHISDKSFYDVLELSQAPVIASHSCARALCDNPRNLNDEMLRALAAKDGVIQMCILSSYVKTPLPNPVRDSARKALRAKFKGFNSLGEEEMKEARREWYALEEQFPEKLATVSDVVDHIDHIVRVAGIRHVGIGTDFDGGGAVIGCEDVSGMGNITLELVRRGYSAKEIKMIWGGNLMRVMHKVEALSKKTIPT
jgi:membrane dipeptidase